MMVKDHEKDLAEFQEEAKTGSDPEVKKFAEDTAKVVQEHLDLAKRNTEQTAIRKRLTAKRRASKGVPLFLCCNLFEFCTWVKSIVPLKSALAFSMRNLIL